ncbi:MAG: DNA alkylation repair protein [Candidatus Woesearchaeota archaeon]
MIIKEIRKELKGNVDSAYKDGCFRYSKEKIRLHGVRAQKTREISRKYFKQLKCKDKKKVFLLCEELLESDFSEEKTIAFDWAFRLRKQYENKDFNTFERWLKKYVWDWASCDNFCTHAFGELIRQYPELILKFKSWAFSGNMWLRRASAVIMIPLVRKKEYLSIVFEIADILLVDKEDLVQKGYGWMLKEASNVYPKEVFAFVMKNKDVMPRTALRYAIEKYPQNLRQKAMGKR